MLIGWVYEREGERAAQVGHVVVCALWPHLVALSTALVEVEAQRLHLCGQGSCGEGGGSEGGGLATSQAID